MDELRLALNLLEVALPYFKAEAKAEQETPRSIYGLTEVTCQRRLEIARALLEQNGYDLSTNAMLAAREKGNE